MAEPAQTPYQGPFDEALMALKAMTDAERIERLKAAGILDAAGELDERYRAPRAEERASGDATS